MSVNKLSKAADKPSGERQTHKLKFRWNARLDVHVSNEQIVQKAAELVDR